MDERTETISLPEVVAFVRKVWIPAVIVAVVAGAIAYYASTFLPKVYQAQAILLTAQVNPEFRQFGTGIATAVPLDVSIYRSVALTRDLLADAQERAVAAGLEKPPSAGAIGRGLTITTEARGTSSLMNLTVRLEDPDAASATANAVAEAIIAWDERRAREAIEELVSTLEAQIRALDLQTEELRNQGGVPEDQIAGRVTLRAQQQEQLYYARVVAGSARGLVEVLQRAAPSSNPVAPRPTRNAVLAAVLGIILVALIVLLRDLLDTRVKGIDGVTAVTGLPLLAAFPDLGDDSRRAPVEAANFLRANLAFSLADAHPKVITVTSSSPGEGKTTVAIGLASSFARQGYRVLLVDADLRKPMVATVLRLPLSDARIDWVLERADEALAVERLQLGEDVELDVIAAVAGIERPAERLASGVTGLLSRAADSYDVIVMDSAPILAVADALPLVAASTATVLAVSVDRSNRRHVARALDVLHRSGARLVGAVATHAPRTSRKDGDGYGYGYGYGYGKTYGGDALPPKVERPVST